MAVYEISTNISSNIFPFASELWGRSVIVPTYDEQYNRTLLSTDDPGYEKGVPQVYYMHNVMPTTLGYQSVGYNKVIDGIALPPSAVLDTIFNIQTASQNRFLFCPAAGLNYIYDQQVGHWASVSPFATGTVPSNVQVTTAFVNGETYIYYANYGCFKYDDTAKVLVAVTLTGLVAANIIAIAENNGYMLAITTSAIAWSSITDPTDFVPSTTTGAGGGSVQENHGALRSIMSVAGGIIIYCEFNAVGGTYSGNSSFPFIYKELPSSGGIQDMSQVAWDTNADFHIVYGSNGIQKFTKTTSSLEYIPASDFLSGKLFEDFNDTTLTFSQQNLSTDLNTKVALVNARYLVFSYGVNAPIFTHALVYDMGYKRWGKLKIDHTACFDWNAPNAYGAITYDMLSTTTYDMLAATTYTSLANKVYDNLVMKRSLGFLQADGTIKIVNFDLSEDQADGVFIIGKFQFRRANWIQHQSTTIDTVDNDGTFSFYVFNSLDGKTLQPAVEGFPLYISSKTRKYNKAISGQNITLCCKGQFNLVSLTITFQMLGNR